jgi:hypothetical protein
MQICSLSICNWFAFFQAKDLIDRISKKLAEHREVLKDAGEDKEDVIFDLAKQIRMVKIGMQQMERVSKEKEEDLHVVLTSLLFFF